MWTTLGLAFPSGHLIKLFSNHPVSGRLPQPWINSPGPDNMAAYLTLLPASSKCTLAISLVRGLHTSMNVLCKL